MRLKVLGLAVLALAAHAPAQSRWQIVLNFGKSLENFLGSEDPRPYRHVGVAYSRPERRLRYRHLNAELVLEGYYERSTSHGVSDQPPNGTDAYGMIGYARYRTQRLVWDIGWGLQYTDQRTVDISSRLSSTPVLAVSYSFPTKDTEILVGLRFMHISNAGLGGNNQGSNQLGPFVAFRF
ncbi:MAG: acyloxyacyl hydrolase [Fimbriimonadales bacterium]